MIDRAPLQPLSWQISGQCIRGDLSGELVDGQTTTHNGQKSLPRAGLQSRLWQTRLRSTRRHQMKQAPSCCNWLSVNHVGYSLTPPSSPSIHLPGRKNKLQNGKTKQQKRKIVDRIPLRLEEPKPLFLWFVLDIGWQHVGVRSVQS